MKRLQEAVQCYKTQNHRLVCNDVQCATLLENYSLCDSSENSSFVFITRLILQRDLTINRIVTLLDSRKNSDKLILDSERITQDEHVLTACFRLRTMLRCQISKIFFFVFWPYLGCW
ncbi:hypothetical protein PUN28_020644 [Cardiocondyla obscurior]|uniref:Uncharacterized protein n=1 Tax=Cardiocondyla obscurior TaxID=286306 RepID=A0AAW2E5I6_9HYME